MRSRWTAIAVALALALTGGCSDEGVVPSGEGEAVKLDTFCTLEGLSSPLRTTQILIDAATVRNGPPEGFAERNPALMALVLGLADPERAIESGATAPRERIVLSVADPRTGAIKQLFAGCVPGVSASELAARRAAGDDGAFSRYFGSDLESGLQQASATFRRQVTLALVQIKPAAAAVGDDAFERSAFARGVRALGPGNDATERRLRRVFFLTDVARQVPPSAGFKAAREAGFAAADRLGADLGRSDFYVVPAGAALSDDARAFLDAFVLRSKADLKSALGFAPDSLSPPPTRIRRYAGSLPLSNEVASPMELQLATAGNGQLVGSWISYSGSAGVRATPIAGSFLCADEANCVLRGDPNGGLGQRWRTDPGSAPEPLVGGPFGGMRMIEGTERNGKLDGRIFDPIIFIGANGDLKFQARLIQ